MEKSNNDNSSHTEAAITSNYRLVVIGLGYVGLTLAGVLDKLQYVSSDVKPVSGYWFCLVTQRIWEKKSV